FFVTILSAVAFTSSGVLYGIFQSVAIETERFVPQDVSIVAQSETNTEAFQQEIKKIEKKFADKDIPFTSMHVNAVEVKSDAGLWNDLPQLIYSYSDYKNIAEMNKNTVMFQPDAETAYMLISDVVSPIALDIPDQVTIFSHEEQVDVNIETA